MTGDTKIDQTSLMTIWQELHHPLKRSVEWTYLQKVCLVSKFNDHNPSITEKIDICRSQFYRPSDGLQGRSPNAIIYRVILQTAA